jgi:hypothetical protein
MLASLATKCTT